MGLALNARYKPCALCRHAPSMCWMGRPLPSWLLSVSEHYSEDCSIGDRCDPILLHRSAGITLRVCCIQNHSCAVQLGYFRCFVAPPAVQSRPWRQARPATSYHRFCRKVTLASRKLARGRAPHALVLSISFARHGFQLLRHSIANGPSCLSVSPTRRYRFACEPAAIVLWGAERPVARVR